MKHVIGKIKRKTKLRTRYRSLKKKIRAVPYVYRTDGARAVVIEVKKSIKKGLYKGRKINHAGDVLFISIDNQMLNHYRVDHMVETLESAGLIADRVFSYELKPEHIKRYNVFIFYRCPWMPEFGDIFRDIRSKNKVSIYAIDDLVIDRRYTDKLPVVQAMIQEDKAVYNDGVDRHGKLMKHCDYAITTTKALADELNKYKNLKEVFIDRNMRNDETIYHSDKAIGRVVRDDGNVIIGYFSGTNTHNEDFGMVASALIRILEKYKNTYIKLAGTIDAPEELKGYEDRLIFTPLVDWRRLPYEIRECHITLAPLVDTLFNRAKSELKWADSALVEVPIVTSDLGAAREVIENSETGILVENTDDAWYDGIELLIRDVELREKIGRQAREYVKENYSTSGHQAMKLCKFIDRITPKVIAFGGVSLSAISGGNVVIKKHMDILQQAGNIVYGVEGMVYHDKDQWQSFNKIDDKKYDIFRINSKRNSDKIDLRMSFDRFIATFWDSVEMVDAYRYIKKGGKKLYLVQGMEADFYKKNDKIRRRVLATYNNYRIEPITISKWCKGWLKSDFGRSARYAPNGIDIGKFQFFKRTWKNRKIKILIEGDNSSEYKRVDESFKIVNKLDHNKYEISYMSYKALPKSWYKVDNIYIKVPYDKVGKIYLEHDILIKSSVLESFSYPPLEIMATGGVPVLVKNDGNSEYVVDGENAIYYELGNIDDAVAKIELLAKNEDKFAELAKNGRKTAESRSWEKIENRVISLYD